jgi:hypothetical protein
MALTLEGVCTGFFLFDYLMLDINLPSDGGASSLKPEQYEFNGFLR